VTYTEARSKISWGLDAQIATERIDDMPMLIVGPRI